MNKTFLRNRIRELEQSRNRTLKELEDHSVAIRSGELNPWDERDSFEVINTNLRTANSLQVDITTLMDKLGE